MTIPVTVVWTIFIAAATWMMGTAGVIIHLKEELRHKKDIADCLIDHSRINLEIMAISIDVKAIAENQGITPAHRPLPGIKDTDGG